MKKNILIISFCLLSASLFACEDQEKKKQSTASDNSSKSDLTQTKEEESSFIDARDNKTYKTVKIGNQVWMAENLNYAASDSKCYDDKDSNCQKYGRLYNWNTAISTCPKGWHLPSDAEWQKLVDFAGGDKVAGKKLKAKDGWRSNGNGTDDFDFAALPSGAASSIGFFFAEEIGGWWSATESNVTDAYYLNVAYSNDYQTFGLSSRDGCTKGADPKENLFSVRCVKD